MIPVFVDSSYFVALMSAKDAWHPAAVQWTGRVTCPLLTTQFVLLEVANSFCLAGSRAAFDRLLASVAGNPRITVLPASPELFASGVELYLQRPDKDWSLTDCISFTVMTQRGMAEALTADHHFRQAGFTTLLR